MTIAYFDCFSGAGGDMIVAALIDAGADVERLRGGLASLGLDGYSLSINKVTRQVLAGTRFHVELQSKAQPVRHLPDIRQIIERSDLSDAVKQTSIRVFERLAAAEASVHGTSVDEVHFHEVGAVDAILDIAGAALAQELLGIDEVICSAIPLGSGTVECEHGTLPVPAPATVELLKGVPVVAGDQSGELTTPTAAAVLTTLATRFGPPPPMKLEHVGYGAGTRDRAERPNLLRVLVGQPVSAGETDEITVLETNLDDSSPEVIGHCLERMLDEGALDAYTVPIQMKKSRPGVLLCVLCEHGDAGAMERILFAETTTFGIRRRRVERIKLDRRTETVATAFGEIRIKVGRYESVVTASAEFEDCRSAAMEHGVPVRDVITAAGAAWKGREG